MAEGTKAELVQTYPVRDSGVGAQFRTSEGQLIDLAPRANGDVFLSWEPRRPLMELAPALGQQANEHSEVILIAGNNKENPTERGNALAERLAKLANAQCIRIERTTEEEVIVWAADWTDDPHRTELEVIAPSWQRAGELAAALGAEELATLLPDLVGRMPTA